MVQAIVPGALALALLSASHVPAPVTSSAQFEQTSSPVEQKLIWVVKPEETLLTIAKTYYGDEKFWTTLWNDNQFISDPNVLSVDEVLTLRLKAPKDQEEIAPSLKTSYPNITYRYVPIEPSVSPVQPVAVQPKPVTTSTPTYAGGPLTEAQITYLGTCEAGMVPTRNSGNGYYGAFQFSIATWNSMNTGYERADLAPIEVQKDAVQRLLSRSSIFTQFPGCARKMQSAGII